MVGVSVRKGSYTLSKLFSLRSLTEWSIRLDKEMSLDEALKQGLVDQSSTWIMPSKEALGGKRGTSYELTKLTYRKPSSGQEL